MHGQYRSRSRGQFRRNFSAGAVCNLSTGPILDLSLPQGAMGVHASMRFWDASYHSVSAGFRNRKVLSSVALPVVSCDLYVMFRE